MTRRIAGIELGGTKSIAVLAQGAAIIDRLHVPTTRPEETVDTLASRVAAWHEAAPLAAIGIGSFGPLILDPAHPAYGCIGGATPKRYWQNADVRGAFVALGVPIGFDTDVGGAALAEGRWGAAQGCTDHIYMTIGTGVGAGIISGGELVHGAGHPEMGHIRVRRAPGDSFAGACPIHGDCLEGLVSGPALQARTGLDGAAIPVDHPIWTSVAGEIAEAMAFLVLTLAPQRIVIGGGVTTMRPTLFPQIISRTGSLLAGYLPDYTGEALARLIVPPQLGDEAGPRGAIALALAALEPASVQDADREPGDQIAIV